MGKLRETVSVFAVALATGGLGGCSSFWHGEQEVKPELAEPQPEFPGPVDRPPTKDGGTIAPPVRLSKLVTADRPPPPISGGSLAVLGDGSLAVAADPDRDAVYIVDPHALDSRMISFAMGSEPGRVVLDSHGQAHVALRNSGTLARIDLKTATIASETKVCSLPRGVAFDGAKDAILVACASGELVSLSATSHAELARSFVGVDLRDVVVDGSGNRFVSRYRSAELLRLNAEGTIAKQTAPLQTRASRFEVTVTNDAERSSDGIEPKGGFGAPREVTLSPQLAWKTVQAPDGTPVMLHQQSQDDEVVISSSGGYGGGCQTITHAGITKYDAEGNAGPSMGLGGAALVVDVAVAKSGRWLAVAKPGAYLRGEQPSVEVLPANLSSNLPSGAPANVKDVATPLADAGVGVALDGGSGFPGGATCMTGWGDGQDMQATAVAFDDNDTLYVFSREPAQLRVYESQGNQFDAFPQFFESQSVALSTKSVRDTGHELFHADVGTGLACASCHGEALDDGHVWNFRDVGPRRTQNMRGGLLKTLPLHWEGDLSSFQNLVDEVMTRRMGGFAVEPRFGDALAGWLDKQPALVMGSGDAVAAQRGKVLFESPEVACASCHSGATLTNNETVDVGTGGKFQVPSLNGVALHAPFMHDGCAATMADRFDPECGGGDKHGKTSQLTRAQIDDLVAYLQTL
jgi:mono/diheme cytochrome c family protein